MGILNCHPNMTAIFFPEGAGLPLHWPSLTVESALALNLNEQTNKAQTWGWGAAQCSPDLTEATLAVPGKTTGWAQLSHGP